MENSKLMTLLFYDGNFNRAGRRMRAVLEREISNGTQTYRLWRGAGKPDSTYPQAENDRYILYVEINGYLAPLGMTDFNLIDHCGYKIVVENLYGGNEERNRCFDSLRESGDDEVRAALKEERFEIERCGQDPVHQANYIKSILDGHVSVYLKAKENGGQTFPDFIGALVMNELARCVELSVVYRAKRRAENEARRVRAEEEEKAYCAERNQIAEQAVASAVQIILNGGVLKNEKVYFYRTKYSSSTYSIINYLMRQYQVDVSLRTQGWINDKLVNATIKDGKCEHLQYLRAKGGRCSQKFFEYMNALIRAVMTQEPKEKSEAA